VMALYWRLVTDADMAERSTIEAALAGGAVNPMAIKKQLGHRIVRMYHGDGAAAAAQEAFEAQFSRREVPANLEEFGRSELSRVAKDPGAATIVDALVASGISDSRSAARRLVEQKAVRVDEALVESWDRAVDPDATFVLRAGRKMKRYKPL